MKPIRVLIALVLASAACGGGSPKPPESPTTPTATDRVLVNVDSEGVAIGGHDPVAYRTANAATPGTAAHASQHGGATYRFASAEHKATFDADMANHAPQYGGYCAFAASQNRVSESDPTVFQIVDGKLLLFTDHEFHRLFNQDVAGNKAKADQNWPGLVAEHGKAPR